MEQFEALIYKFPMSETAVALAKTDETGATPQQNGDIAKSDPRGFLDETRRKLTLEEAASAAGIQWFQYEIGRLDRETSRANAEISRLRGKNEDLIEKYNDKRVEVETLKGQAARSKKNEILSTLVIAAGSAGLGAAPSFFGVAEARTFAIIAMIISAMLVVSGIVLRMWK